MFFSYVVVSGRPFAPPSFSGRTSGPEFDRSPRKFLQECARRGKVTGRTSKLFRVAGLISRAGTIAPKRKVLARSRVLPGCFASRGDSELTGLEPATSAVTGRRSNQLSYNSSEKVVT